MIWESRFALPAGILAAYVLPWLAALLWLLKLRLFPRTILAVGLAAPLGMGLVYVLLLPAAALLPPDVAGYAVAGALLVLVIGALFVRRPGPAAPAPRRPPRDGVERGLQGYLSVLVGLCLLTALLGPATDTDTVAMWAIKGRHIAAKGLDTTLFAGNGHPDGYPHPSYPLFVPAQNAWVAISLGHWSDRALRVWPVVLGASLLLLGASAMEERGVPGRRAWLVAALFASSPSFLRAATAPRADLALGVLVATCVVLLHLVWSGADPRLLVLSGAAAGLAGVTKREGLVIVPILLIAALPAAGLLPAPGSGPSRARLTRFALFAVPALAFPLSWILYVRLHQIPVGYPEPIGPLQPGAFLPALLRVLRHFGHDFLFSHTGSGAPDDWLLLLPALAAVVLSRPKAFLASRAWHCVAIAAAWIAVDAVALVLAPWPLEYLLAATADRLVLQIAPLLFLAVGSTLAEPAPATDELAPTS